MNPSERLLCVMEYLMAAGPEPVKQIDITRDLRISRATLNRIMKVLSENGYVFRTSEKYCVPNFRFTKNVPMSEAYLSVLNRIMTEITEAHRVSTEAVVVTGQDLFWHSRTKLPNSTLPIRARPGFRRPLYELDAMARLYLGRLGWEQVDYQFNVKSFHDNGPMMTPYDPAKVKEIIEEHAGRDFAYDFEGNRVGLRRFVIVVEDLDGSFLHFLTMAEAAVPVADREEREERIAAYREVLAGARERLRRQMETGKRAAGVMRPAKNEGGAWA